MASVVRRSSVRNLNGLELEVENVAVVRVMRQLASGDFSEVQLAKWVRDHLS